MWARYCSSQHWECTILCGFVWFPLYGWGFMHRQHRTVWGRINARHKCCDLMPAMGLKKRWYMDIFTSSQMYLWSAFKSRRGQPRYCKCIEHTIYDNLKPSLHCVASPFLLTTLGKCLGTKEARFRSFESGLRNCSCQGKKVATVYSQCCIMCHTQRIDVKKLKGPLWYGKHLT